MALGLYGLHSAWAALGLYHAGMLVSLFVLDEPKSSASRPTIRLVWIILVACLFAAGGAAIYFLRPYLDSGGSPITNRLAAYGVTKHTWPLLAFYFCIVNSTLEEFFWRGRLMSGSVPPHINDLLFASYHAFILRLRNRSGPCR